MSSSRDQNNNDNSAKNNLNENVVVDWTYPYGARAKNNLLLRSKTFEDAQARSSAHAVNKAIKAQDDIDLEYIKQSLKYDQAHRFYFFKRNEPGNPISELEALCAAFYQFIAPENVPSTHAIYEESWCNFILVDKPPTLESVDDLPMTANSAYVRYQDKDKKKDELYFVRKENKETKETPSCRLLRVKPETLAQFDKILATDKLKSFRHQCRVLSADDLKLLEKHIKPLHNSFPYVALENGCETHRFVGVRSKAIKDFKTNHDDPLEEKDTAIELVKDLIKSETEAQRNAVCDTTKKLLDYLIEFDKKEKENQSTIGSGISYVKGLLNRYVNSDPTSIQLIDCLDSFKDLVPHKKLDIQNIQVVLEFIRQRATHINTAKQKEKKYDPERELLRIAAAALENLLDLLKQQEVTISANKQLEEAYQAFVQSGRDVKELQDSEPITCDGFKITGKDLKNYRIVKRLAVALVSRYLMQDTDGHNQNMSKDGWLIDFDMAKLHILFQFRNPKISDKLLRQPNKDTFKVTANDIEKFPCLEDADFYYWPTKPTILTKSMAQTLSFVYTVRENFFEKKDNKAFKKLADHPVFVFHKFKTFLKYIMTDDKMFRNIGKLHLREDLRYKDWNDGQCKKLLDRIIDDEKERIAKVREVLVKMPQFQGFLKYNGEYARGLIKNEFRTYRNKYRRKIYRLKRALQREKNKKTKLQIENQIRAYQDLVNSINLDQIQKRYQQICEEAGVKNSNSEEPTVEPLPDEFTAMLQPEAGVKNGNSEESTVEPLPNEFTAMLQPEAGVKNGNSEKSTIEPLPNEFTARLKS